MLAVNKFARLPRFFDSFYCFRGFMTKPPTTDLDKLIGARIRAIREEHGLSAAKAAALINASPQQMSRYELGQNKITCSQLYTIARALKLPVSWFFQGVDVQSDAKKEAPEYISIGEDDGLKALLAYWPRLTPQQRNAILGVLDTFPKAP